MKLVKAILSICLIILSYSVTYADNKLNGNIVKPKVAFITAAGDIKGPYNRNLYSGLESAYNSNLISNITYYISGNTAEYMPQIDKFVKDGYTIIVVVTIFMHDVAVEAAKKYPNIKFILVDVDYSKGDDELDNLYEIAFDQDQASFMSGVIAGLIVDKYHENLLPNAAGSKKLGILQAMQIPNINAVTNSFRNGVNYVCQSCNITVETVNSFTDAHKSNEAATNMYKNDVDIILPIVGANIVGVLKASQEQGKYIIGTNTDLHLASPFVVFSIIKNLGFALEGTLREIILTPSKAEHRKTYNMHNGGTSISPFYDYEKNVPQEMKDKMKEIEEELRRGDIVSY